MALIQKRTKIKVITVEMILVEHLTKDYGSGRGVFDVSFAVQKGEVFGFLGPNGAGKTTTIRHIMGFSKPHTGRTSVLGIDSWINPSEIQRDLGYLPGELAFPQNLSGLSFIAMMAKLRGLKDMSKMEYLSKKFDLDPRGSIKRMSLGTKRKLAIVTAFMHDPDILVLDEPTSGLDPIMQKVFTDFVLEEKDKGKTVLLSSHIFSEVDATCDRIAIIKDGKIVSTVISDTLRHNESKVYKIEFSTEGDFNRFIAEEKLEIQSKKTDKRQVKVLVNDAQINTFFTVMAAYSINFLSEIKFTLEDYFMDFYDENLTVEEGLKNVTH
ncbi:MAG: ATP-binding cassette domain-containing protein [Spirochaetaceae bacterium]|nr:ATP-binding cassette domain-containing protein [Spirochaetaceae bacterium]